MRIQIVATGGFPGGPVVKNPPSNAGDTGSIPGQGSKISHAAGQLNLCATTTEKPAVKSPYAAMKNQRSQKKRKENSSYIVGES